MNIIFDLGNVLIEWNKEKILSKICKNDLEYNLFNQFVFQSNLWIDLDNGKISLEFLENQLIDEMGHQYQDQIHELVWNWFNYVDLYDEVYELIKQLKKKNFQIYVLSNTSSIFHILLDSVLSKVSSVLNGYVISCEVKMMKPQKEIYLSLVNKYQLDIKDCIFLDDLEENVEAARTLGIKAFQIKERKEISNILKDLLN
ncbi:HAD family phosphatase [Streptococcus pneumoniae]|uniref:HAD family hydrolase n=1 Tax=Streptococcus pneumoniae TaxID=1313 RepID=UPI0007696ECD|nr:HAD family phosphatase [Streptococcus pneumoniae]MDA2901422.1 HAD family phosphatase [Streptococcus pneumoniae]MDA2906132.1 HAD family phosphatase [Streptococcus pneumoniae]MDS2274310.1 HAD family phosphatase [Streptococcus pneumoniae]MDS2555688.1 HAD family phosphatase [Streptococcus pneumoniae]MDS2739618.1 HAD family phosphatase [Streptococcus pneumoniae]